MQSSYHVYFNISNHSTCTFSSMNFGLGSSLLLYYCFSGRKKRQAEDNKPRNTCGLLAVIDTKFLDGITQGDEGRATNYVVR